MISDESSPVHLPSPAAACDVSLSPNVHERFPSWEELLSAYGVVRRTRRPRWLVLSLALLGRFPRKRHFRGRGIGWLRSDVVHWLAKDLRTINGAYQGGCSTPRNMSRPGTLAGASKRRTVGLHREDAGA
jgi:predicted DNA-binding transcriptional regulator AlpA